MRGVAFAWLGVGVLGTLLGVVAAAGEWWLVVLLVIVLVFHIGVWRNDFLRPTVDLNDALDDLETAQRALCEMADRADHLLEALDEMVTYHLGTDEGTVEHNGAAVNQYACDLLVRYRSDRWGETPHGIERIGR